MRTLKEIPCGETVKVAKLTGEGAVKRRIMDMGITRGIDVFVRKVAPLGDPVEVTVRGYELSLRKALLKGRTPRQVQTPHMQGIQRNSAGNRGS